MTGSLVNMELKKNLKKLFLVIVFVLSFLQTGPTIQAYAFGGIGIKSEFDSLEGDAKFLGSEYRNNYKLDLEELGITEPVEKALNGLANLIFILISITGYLTAAFFYIAMDFDLAALLQPQINQVQETLHNGLFTPLFPYAFAAAMILAICKYARRDFVGLIEQFGKVCFIILLSYLVVTDSGKMLSTATVITKGASVSILTGINDIDVGNNVKNYAANAAGVLWVSLVHEPWKALEFGEYNYTDEDVEFFLTHTGDERKSKVASMMDGDKGPFSKDRTVFRIGQGLIIFFMTSIKGLIYILVSILYFLFQVIAVFFVLMAPLILLLSLVPGYDFEILGVWARKIMETQIGVLMITFVIGVMVFFDRALQSLAQTMGWFIVLVLQIAICFGLYAFRWQILMSFNNIQRGIQNPRLLKRQLLRTGNPYTALERQHMIRQFGKVMYSNNRNHNNNGNHNNYNNNREAPEAVPNKSAKSNVKRPNTSSKASQDQNNERSYYYASGAETDNWRDMWNNAAPRKRPSTQEKTKVVKSRPMLAQVNGITPVKASVRSRGSVKTNRGYIRSSQFEKEPLTVKWSAVNDNDQSSPARSNGNVIELPDTKRPVIDRNYALPDKSVSIPVRRYNTAKLEPRVSVASFHQASGLVQREKISPDLIRKHPGRGGAIGGAGQAITRPNTDHFRLEAAATREGIKYQEETHSSGSRPITTPDQEANSLKGMITRQENGGTKRPAPTMSHRPTSNTRPISNSPGKDLKNGTLTYNSASEKISDAVIRGIKGEQIKIDRPETNRMEEGEKIINSPVVSRPESKEKVNESKVKPVRQMSSKQSFRHGNSKPEVGKTFRTTPRVQNATVNGFKSLKGNSDQDTAKTARKAIQIPN